MSCSVSDISIGWKDSIYFIPLAKGSPRDSRGSGNITSGFMGVCDLYQSLTLPIEGTYDDYGALENIKENMNTRFIEKFFKIKIKDFINAIERNRFEDIHDKYHPAFKDYIIPKLKTILAGYKVEISEKILKIMEFKKNKDHYKFKDHKYKVFLIDTTNHFGKKCKDFYITDENDLKLESNKDIYSRDSLEKFIFDYTLITDHNPAVKKDRQKESKVLSNLSGMYVHKEIYDYYSDWEKVPKEDLDSLSGEFLLSLGFKRSKHKTNSKTEIYYDCSDNPSYSILAQENKHFYLHKDRKNIDYLYSIKELSQSWKKYTGQEIDISAYQKITYFEKEIEKKQNLFNEYNKKSSTQDKKFISEHLNWMINELWYEKFRDNPKIIKFYNKELSKKYFFKEMLKFKNFINSLRPINKMMMPRFSGTQEGAYPQEEELIDLSKKIITKLKTKWDEEDY